MDEAFARLEQIRGLMLPILESIEAEYTPRVRRGYPTIVDNIRGGGVFGLDLDPGFGIYFMTDGSSVYAEIHRVALRTDTLSMANAEKFGGQPSQRRVDIDPNWDDLRLRNLVSELLSAWNYQQLAIFRVDS